jgi:rubredoxin
MGPKSDPPDTGAYQCPVCDYVYDEANGDAREGFPAGTRWEEIPDDWCCPDCAVREKPDFTQLRIGASK